MSAVAIGRHDYQFELTLPSGEMITISPLCAMHLAGLRKIFTLRYGHYPYQPDESAIEAPGLYLVATTPDGKVVAGGRSTYLQDGIFDFGSLAVHPDYAEQGIGRRILQMRSEHARLNDARLLQSEPVCTKTCASQRNLRKRGWLTTGIHPVRYPGVLAAELGQPLSNMHCVLDPNKQANGEGTVHPDFWPIWRMLHHPGRDDQRVIHTGPMPDIIPHKAREYEGVRGSAYKDIPWGWTGTWDAWMALHREGWRFCGIRPNFGVLPDKRGYFTYIRLYWYDKPILADSISVTPENEPIKNHVLARYPHGTY